MHPRRSIPRALLTALLVGPIAPAQTLVVDIANGPGTSFTSLELATAAAPSGALLIVRPGDYTGVIVIQGKSLTVLGEPGARLVGSTRLIVRNLTASQSVFVRNFGLVAPPQTFGGLGIRCESNAGLVCLENLTPTLGSVGPVGFEATNCGALWLRTATFSDRVVLANCTAVLRNCGVGPGSQTLSLDAIVQSGGAVQLIDCTVNGASSFVGTPAVQLYGGDLRLLGGTALHGGASLFGAPALAVAGTGSLRAEPGVTLTGGGTVLAPSIVAATQAMPRLLVDEGAPAGTWTAQLFGPFGDSALLLASLPGVAFQLPWLTDAVWLDPLSMVVVGAGVPAPGAPVTATIALPAVSPTLGFWIVWQALTLDAACSYQLGNPEFSILH